jgi:hypothetical protein
MGSPLDGSAAMDTMVQKSEESSLAATGHMHALLVKYLSSSCVSVALDFGQLFFPLDQFGPQTTDHSQTEKHAGLRLFERELLWL